MAGKPKGDVALTNRERNRAYRVRKQRADLDRARTIADMVAALGSIAMARTLSDARRIALFALADHAG